MTSSIDRLLKPRSIAIVGVNDKNNAGAQALSNAVASGFMGPIYPINPNYTTLQGLKCYPSITALPDVPDSVIVSVPVAGAMTVLREAAEFGIPSIIFFNGGFTDAGNEAGLQRNAELIEVARKHNMAVAGPNCMGVSSRSQTFDSSFIPQPMPRRFDGISIVSQSGGLINAFVELATNRGIGLNYLISSGNEAVLNSSHYIDWLADDPETKVIISVVEGVKDGSAFRAALRRATSKKPVVVLKLGRSDAGRDAVMAHTGSLAGSAAVFKAMCAQCGAVLADTVDSAIETAAMFLRVPLPKGDRTVIFSGSGGATALATDLASALGLKFHPLSTSTNKKLQDIFKVGRPFINPFDVGAYPLFAKDSGMERCLNTLLADDEIDLIACVLIVQRDLQPLHLNVFRQMASAAAGAKKPVVLLSEMTSHWDAAPHDLGVYTSGSLHDGLTALRALSFYADYRHRMDKGATPAAIKVALPPPAPPRRVLTEYQSKRILASAGLPVTREILVHTADAAAAAAADLGFPVALKIQSPDLMHKTDVGALALRLADADAVRSAFNRLSAVAGALQPPPKVDGYLVQEMVTGTEFFLGMKRDPVLGPVIAVNPGGIFVELLKDSTILRLPPINLADAMQALDENEVAKRLLEGFRGAPAGDKAALANLVAQFSLFAAGLSDDVVAIDLNPVTVLPGKHGVRIVDAAIEFARDED